MRLLRFVLLAALVVSCKKSPMGRVEAIRDELAKDGPKFSDSIAPCSGDGCGAAVAQSIGGKYDEKKPDQITAATVAVIVARDHRGSAVGSPDVWLTAMRKAKGPGADALRLATALEMRQVVSKHARALDTDADGRAFLLDVAAAIPGACHTYLEAGGGTHEDTLPIADSPDHSACVQRDLTRKDGPGATYGQGLFRAVAGALALWKETLAALHEGDALTGEKAKDALDRRLAVLDQETPKILPKVVAAPQGNDWSQQMQTEHDTPLGSDAGAAPASTRTTRRRR